MAATRGAQPKALQILNCQLIFSRLLNYAKCRLKGGPMRKNLPTHFYKKAKTFLSIGIIGFLNLSGSGSSGW